MADWKRCTGSCRRVLAPEFFDGDEQTRCRACIITDDSTPKGRKGPMPGTVRRPDVRARSRAVKRLIEMHQPAFERLLAEEIRSGS